MDLPSGTLQTFPVQYHAYQIASGVLGDAGRHSEIFFSNSFEQTRNHGADDHDAIDIFGPLGVRVVATVNGFIPETWRVSGRARPAASPLPSGDGGFAVVMVADDTRHYHYFAHLSGPPVVASGMRVQAGQLLGYLGDSGRARGNPHLHYQVSIRTATGAVRSFLNPYHELRRLSGPGAVVARANSRVRIPLSGGGPD